MADESAYKDVRSQMWRAAWEKSQSYDEYLAASEEKHAIRWREQEAHVQVSDEQTALLKSFVREMNLLVVSGVWCGDCVRQGPIFRALELVNPNIRFRYLEREDHPDVMDEVRIAGAKKVPAVACLSEDFFEVGRFCDRTLSVYRRKAASELGPTCPVGIGVPHPDELAEEVCEWVEIIEHWHLLLRLSPLLRQRHAD